MPVISGSHAERVHISVNLACTAFTWEIAMKTDKLTCLMQWVKLLDSPIHVLFSAKLLFSNRTKIYEVYIKTII